MTILNFVYSLFRRVPDAVYKTFKVFYWEIQHAGMSWCGSIYVPKNHSDEMIRHEYGHCLQYQTYGFWRFVFTISIASMFGMVKYKLKKITFEQYHQIKTEAEADKLGGNTYFDESGYLNPPLAEEEIQKIIDEKGVKNG